MHLWFNTFLERAAGSPLTIDLSYVVDVDVVQGVATQDLLKTLIPHAHSIQDLTMKTSSLSPVEANINLTTSSLSQMITLEKLNISCVSRGDAAVIAAALAAAQLTRNHLPRLRCLTLCGTNLPWHSSLYHHLQVLKLRNIVAPPPANDLLALLRHSPDLEVLHIEYDSMTSPPFTPNPNTSILAPVVFQKARDVLI